MNNLKYLVLLLFCSIALNNVGGKSLNIHQLGYAEKLTNNAKDVKNLDSLYSNKKLGVFVDSGKTFFRVFAPTTIELKLFVFSDLEDTIGTAYVMQKDEDGVWEIVVDGLLTGKYYGFKSYKENDNGNEYKPLIVDPYAKAVATFNTYMNPRKSIIIDENYDWGNDKWIQKDWRDLIIYEMHVRDLTAHKTAESKFPGTYKGLIEKGIKGGINYIKSLGVNAVELLPSQEFGNIEIPYKKSLAARFNTWNPYERNHWGYMTSNFFAPAAYYSEDWDNLKWNTWMGKDGKQVNQFKDMVKAFHSEGIAVIMDVVYNHLSEYETGNLKELDREYYFRLDTNGNYLAESGCGNDLKTERPMMRKLIVESILYWMKEYHIDGFRFDLAKLIDWETIEEIIREAKKVNPNVVIVCEPWGGGYDPKGFSLREWGSWNDQIRNGVKGENPLNGLGWIFGKWYGNNDIDRIKSYVNGTLISDKDGLFQKKEHAVNYLESHDGYTFGDFVRIGLNSKDTGKVISDAESYSKLDEKQLKINKLGALFLFTSQGITMIHSGQEYSRSKVIPFDVTVDDRHKGMIDHNTYNKDNEVNYIDYNIADINKNLVNYYKGLILLRKTYAAFRHAEKTDIKFFDDNNKFFLGYQLDYKKDNFVVYFNADTSKTQKITLPTGKWDVLVNGELSGIESLQKISGTFSIKPSTGLVLKKRK
ncbi:MAG: alpha-amylase family glycosyl hydrolase [bacterium]